MMYLVVVGVNHKTAPVALREQLAFGDDLAQALMSLNNICDGAVIVSTCNRSEIYAYMPNNTHHDDGILASVRLQNWLMDFKGIHDAQIHHFLYIYEGAQALTHWLRVASGLDSMILGEPQILGQIKRAVSSSHQHGAMSARFDWLTQKIFACAKIVRKETKLGEQAVSLGFAVAKLATQIFQSPKDNTLLIVAAGEMNRLVAQNVLALGLTRVMICNRTHDNAKRLSDELHAQAHHDQRTIQVSIHDLSQLKQCLSCADIVSSCSASMATLIDKTTMQSVMKIRKNRAMLLVDLAIPRDIEPSVADLDNIYLYSVDDLQHVIADNINTRKQAATEAEVLVSQLVVGIEEEWQIQTAGQLVKQYHAQAQQHKQILLDIAHKQLSNGMPPETVLTQFANKLANTLTHSQKHLIRQIAAKKDDETLHFVTDNLMNAYRQKP